MEKPSAPANTEPVAVESLPEKPVTEAKAAEVKGGARTADPTQPVGGMIDRSF